MDIRDPYPVRLTIELITNADIVFVIRVDDSDRKILFILTR